MGYLLGVLAAFALLYCLVGCTLTVSGEHPIYGKAAIGFSKD